MPRGDTYTLRQWSGEVIEFDGKLITHSCPGCHIVHAFPKEMDDRALRYNAAEYPNATAEVYCPNGHPWHYTGKNAEQKRIERLEQNLQYADKENDRLRGQRDVAKRQAAARKGQVTRMRNRIAAGICPVAGCRANLGDRVRAHIAKQHPEFRMAEVDSLAE